MKTFKMKLKAETVLKLIRYRKGRYVQIFIMTQGTNSISLGI